MINLALFIFGVVCFYFGIKMGVMSGYTYFAGLDNQIGALMYGTQRWRPADALSFICLMLFNWCSLFLGIRYFFGAPGKIAFGAISIALSITGMLLAHKLGRFLGKEDGESFRVWFDSCKAKTEK